MVLAFFSLFYTLSIDLQYKYDDLDKEFFSLFPEVKNRFIILEDSIHSRKLAAYATMLYNLSMPTGLSEEYLPMQLEKEIKETNELFRNKDCSFKKKLKNLNVDELITMECDFVTKCRLKIEKTTKNLCLVGIT